MKPSTMVRAALAALAPSLALALALALASGPAYAEWPDKPITLVVPLAAGGSTDTTARLLADKLHAILGQTVVVDNRTGAGGNIGADYVAKAAPDGYTLLLTTSTMLTNVSLFKSLPYDVVRDLAPVGQVVLIPNVLMVNPDIPAKNLRDFVAYIRAKKTPINYGSAGNGSSQHLAGALFNTMAGGDMEHVPYKGGAPANADLMAGQIQAVFSPLVEVLPYIDSGKLRPLGVTTKTRSARIPTVPAIDEVLPGFEIVMWNGVFAPARTPPAIIAKLNAAIKKVLAEPSVRKTLAEQGSTPVGNSPEEFRAVIGPEIEKWGKLVKLSGAQAQ